MGRPEPIVHFCALLARAPPGLRRDWPGLRAPSALGRDAVRPLGVMEGLPWKFSKFFQGRVGVAEDRSVSIKKHFMFLDRTTSWAAARRRGPRAPNAMGRLRSHIGPRAAADCRNSRLDVAASSLPTITPPFGRRFIACILNVTEMYIKFK